MGLGAAWSSGRSHWLELDDLLGPSLPKPFQGLCADSQDLSNCVILSITACIQARGNTGVATCLPFGQAAFSQMLIPFYQLSIPGSPGGDAELQLNDQLRRFGDFCVTDTRSIHSSVSKEKDCSSSFSFLPLSNPWEQSRAG